MQWLLVEQELTCASEHLLVDPVLLAALPAAELLGLEPESNLLIRGLNSVRTVTDVAANLEGESIKCNVEAKYRLFEKKKIRSERAS